ncbi:lipid A core-O-antigen ligase [Klebsiella michiganensis]|uniref:Lipid A core-O-antigen ligase n=1 Tax=Klebsiella michiganensis TaxID=1134687 RepID=A0A7H4PEF3_9ENTR|nr:lipid A core-O-antigen ligase [Klebsiella michiganensis]
MALAALLLTLPLLWSPSVDWRLDAFPRLAGLWAGVAFYYLLLNCRLTPRQQQTVLWLIVAATLIQAGLCAGGDRPSGVAAAAGAGGAAPVRSVRDRRFSATQRHRLLSCHRRRGAAVVDRRRPLYLPQRHEGEISSVGKRARARVALRYADSAEVPHRVAGPVSSAG